MSDLFQTVTAVDSSHQPEASHRHLINLRGELDGRQQEVREVVKRLRRHEDALPLLHCLAVRTEAMSAASAEEKLELFDAISSFLMEFSEAQVKVAPRQLKAVLRWFSETGVQEKCALQCVLPLRSTLQKISAHSWKLTVAHAPFALVCLHSKCYNAAREVIASDIMEANAKTSGVDPVDLLLYLYYGGMLHIGLKQYSRAIDFLRLAITTPASALSAIVLEAYKKLILVSLIEEGEVKPLPKYTSSVVSGFFEQVFKSKQGPYEELVKAFKASKLEQLEEIVRDNSQTLTRDNNLGLAKQCIEALKRRKIQRLTLTYVTLSLSDIASSVGLRDKVEAEKYIVHMISKGQISASIAQDTEMVTFLESEEEYDDNQIAGKLNDYVQAVSQLSDRLRALEKDIITDPSYVTKQKRSTGEAGEKMLPSSSASSAPGISSGYGLPPDYDENFPELGSGSSYLRMT